MGLAVLFWGGRGASTGGAGERVWLGKVSVGASEGLRREYVFLTSINK